eukprot:6000439-Pyramimonas_sp.AAC.1
MSENLWKAAREPRGGSKRTPRSRFQIAPRDSKWNDLETPLGGPLGAPSGPKTAWEEPARDLAGPRKNSKGAPEGH